MEKVKVGIIGCGGIAADKHLPALTQIPEVNVAAFYDLNKERAQSAASQFGASDAKVYEDVGSLLDDGEISVVHICTTSKTHTDLTMRALKAGKHVMCEKPIAATVPDAKRMVEAAGKAGKLLTFGCQNRFREDVQYLKRICERGDLGEIYFGKALALRRRGVPSWLLVDKDDQGGGPLLDIGTHALDMTLWLMDNFKPRCVMGSAYHKLAERSSETNLWKPWDPQKFIIPESAFGYITMQNGATVLLESSWALNIRKPIEARTVLCGTEGGADMCDGLWINGTEYGAFYEKHITTDKIGNFGKDDIDFTFRSKYGAAGNLEARCWIDSILYGKDLVVKPEQSLVVYEILEAVAESARTGKPIYF